MTLPASVRCWPLLWSLPLLIQSPSDQDATSRPGSVSCRSSTRVEARTGSAVSVSKVTAICAVCSWPAAHKKSFAHASGMNEHEYTFTLDSGDMERKNKDGVEGRLIGSAELRQMAPFSDAHFWRLEQAGEFPRRIKIGQHRVGWALDEITAWIATGRSYYGSGAATSVDCLLRGATTDEARSGRCEGGRRGDAQPVKLAPR